MKPSQKIDSASLSGTHPKTFPPAIQNSLFPFEPPPRGEFTAANSSTFVGNMTLPVHRWFRFSGGFSAAWVESVFRELKYDYGLLRVFDPFVGSGTTLIAAETSGIESFGIDAHPFVTRIGRAKLAWRTDPNAYLRKINDLHAAAMCQKADLDGYPTLIRKCYDDETLKQLDVFRRGYEIVQDDSPASELAWLTLVTILRKVASVGTAPWQYILPAKKTKGLDPITAFNICSRNIYEDMLLGQSLRGPSATLIWGDARTCERVPKNSFNLVLTSPPYANNYDYADATRLEMSFMGEISGWGDLQETVRKYLIRSCSQHVPERSVDLEEVLRASELDPIRSELTAVCEELADVRKTKGGRKTYHLMIACYFRDLAQTWRALRAVATEPSTVCFVIGDSAPYGVYIPTVPWLGALALAAGFKSFSFKKTRDRNIKWKNRKHRVPLQEGQLWVQG